MGFNHLLTTKTSAVLKLDSESAPGRSVTLTCDSDTNVLKATIPTYTGTNGNVEDKMVITFSDPGYSNSGIRDVTIETSN